MGQRAAIYARVSTLDQNRERQLRDLAAFAKRGGFDVVAAFAETASGTKDSRRERRIDAVHVAELSRWGTRRWACSTRYTSPRDGMSW